MSIAGPFGGGIVAESKEHKFVTVNPGSKIEFWGAENPEHQEADVIQRILEYGAVAIPALVLRVSYRKDPIVITENGRWHVRVILDAGKIGGKEAPEKAIVVTTKPVSGVAVRFDGGGESATQLIRWIAGRHAIQYRQPDEVTESPEALILTTLSGDVECIPGWYIVYAEDTFKVVTDVEFTKLYEVKA